MYQYMSSDEDIKKENPDGNTRFKRKQLGMM